MEEGKGASYEVEGTQVIAVDVGGIKQEQEQTFNMKMNYTPKPLGMHITGKIEAAGQSFPVEIYMEKDTLYQKSLDGTWLQSQGVDMESLGGQTQEPNAALKQLKQVIAKLKNDKESDTVKMTEKNDAYLLELSINEKTDQAIRDLFQKQMKATMGSQLEQSGMPVDFDKIKVKKFKQVMWIDKESFTQKKVEQEMMMEIPIDQMTMTADQKMVMTHTGPYDKKITVPEEVKNSAK